MPLKLQLFIVITCLEEVDCGVPSVGIGGVVTGPYNNTKFNTVITFHCELSNTSSVLMTVCGSNGEWFPNPSSFECQNGTLGSC